MKKERKKRRIGRRKTSIFFLLWTAFALFLLFVVICFSVFQRVLIENSNREAVTERVVRAGNAIYGEITTGKSVGNEYVYRKEMEYDVRVYVVEKNGEVIYPFVPNEEGENLDLSKTLENALKRLGAEEKCSFEDGEGNYVYVAKIYRGFTQICDYLCVTQTIRLNAELMRKVNLRTALISLGAFVVAFFLAGAVSGLITKPISEISEKAKLLAQGDFGVDFGGESYTSELSELADTLNFASAELSKTDKMQRELIANVSHDFKTPLTMIKGYASMIQEISGDDKEKREKHAQIIIDETDRLASLVGDVLDLSKINSELNAVHLETFDLSAFTLGILEKFGYLADTQGYVFEKRIEGGLLTEADRLKIGQVIYNLVGNAVNYTGADKRVTVELKRENGVILFSVRDTGEGLDEQERATIWTRYYRSKENHVRPVQGTGLGLSIVKAVLDKHAFRYGVESEKGKGSTFFVYFPLR